MPLTFGTSSFDIAGADPIVGGAAVTPNDSTDLTRQARALWIGGTGTLRITTQEGGTLNLTAVPVGLLWLRATRVHATGTTCTNILALY